MKNYNGEGGKIKYVKPQYPLSDLTARIIGAALEVHHFLGNGFQEKVYQRALAIELTNQKIDFVRGRKWKLYIKERISEKEG